MINILLVLNIIVVVLLIGIILLQKSEGGVLGMGGSGSKNGLFTARSAGNLITKTTYILGALFFIICILLAFLVSRRDTNRSFVATMMEKNKIENGTRFGKLVVIEDLGLRPHVEGHNRRWYKCQCDCGCIKEVMGNSLKTNHIMSCGTCNFNSSGEY